MSTPEPVAVVCGALVKPCTRCNVAKQEDAYSVRTNGRRQSWCRPCVASHNRDKRALKRAEQSGHNEHADRCTGDCLAADCRMAARLITGELPPWLTDTIGETV